MTLKLWNNNFYLAKEQLYSLKKNGLNIFEQLNHIVILMSCLKLISAIIENNQLRHSYLALFVYLLPLLLSTGTHFLLAKKRFTACFILSFYCMPVSIILVGLYEQMTYLVLFEVAYGIVGFFILQKRSYIIISYTFTALTGLMIGIREILNTTTSPTYQIGLLILNFCIFFIPFYFILGYIRGIIELALKNKSLAESTEFQNKVVTILSHDIRVPLVAIKNMLTSYSKEKISKETILEYLPDIEENVRYLNDLFEDMLCWSKAQRTHQELEKEYLSLKDITEEVCHAYIGAASSKRITLHNQINDSRIIFANERSVKVILRNLISNAIKFTDMGGDIFIYSEKNDFFDTISVKDTGRGISEENLKKIRNGLEVSTKGTLDESGTGLGLYFCKDFAIKNGGALFVESEQGKGSTFSFTIPLKKKL
ncbi:HAMP domain-containing histidine kinase [Ferruginibacter lapsinanis]|uniref:sensor histidine kinase n=1 Tax=Ferruginibacter lapsinanis TaxID=563172 RepID=UPI001E527A71|nr:HAMP domain-containing sensor histidine kinase [Ferruginibacter lapsinanis]UEG48656.1 HAMP domain-containing histidine kinase [Ferruginibacter lapsinanis]